MNNIHFVVYFLSWECENMSLEKHEQSTQKLDNYLTNFESTQRRLEGRLRRNYNDTPYEEKYSHIQIVKQSKLLLEYVDYVKEYYPHIFYELKIQELIEQISKYVDLTDADKVKLYKTILKIHR